MMGRMKSLRAIVLCTLLGLGGVYAWMQTPSYSVYHIQQALKTRNYETFTQYVDIDSVIAIQQTFQNSDLTLPQIPTIALIGTVVGGETREDIRYFSVPLDSGEEIEIGLRYTPAGWWRVVRVTNVQALLKAVFRE